MAKWIISHFPEHASYLEPYFGSGAILCSKPRSKLETVNDLDNELVNLFKVMRSRPKELADAIQLTPYSRQEYYESYYLSDCELENARRLIIRLWQGRGGKTSHRTGWRNQIECNGPLPANEWIKFPRKIAAVAERLQGVQIENQDAIKLIERHKRENVLIYADPPYVLSTRTTSRYKHEMNNEQHIQLIEALEAHPGPAIISGYANEIYDTRLKHWTRKTKRAKAEAGAIREEVIWINPIAAVKLNHQQTLF